MGMTKNRCGQSGARTLKLTVSEEWTDGINWIFACWYRFTKSKIWSKSFWVGMVEYGCGKSGYGTVKLTLPQKWTDEINWFFCRYKFRKVKCWFNDFWVGVVKNDHGLLVHETLKSYDLDLVSYERIYELSWFLNADRDAIIFDQTDMLLFDF